MAESPTKQANEVSDVEWPHPAPTSELNQNNSCSVESAAGAFRRPSQATYYMP